MFISNNLSDQIQSLHAFKYYWSEGAGNIRQANLSRYYKHILYFAVTFSILTFVEKIVGPLHPFPWGKT